MRDPETNWTRERGRTRAMLRDFRLRWKEAYENRKQYATTRREPFFSLAGKYLPEKSDALVVDLGAGQGAFAEQEGLTFRYENLFLLDCNQEIVAELKKKHQNVALYRAPASLPFTDETVHYLHCSHMIEHLTPADVYLLLKEIDRVLCPGARLVVSSPLLWEGFYGDLDHVKPYPPGIIVKFLARMSGFPSMSNGISREYRELKTVYRYFPVPPEDGWGADAAWLDFLVQFVRSGLWKIGIRHYVRSGYTVVLEKKNRVSGSHGV